MKFEIFLLILYKKNTTFALYISNFFLRNVIDLKGHKDLLTKINNLQFLTCVNIGCKWYF